MRNLYIFDFDDTLVSTGSLIRIKSPKNKEVRCMTSAEFADPECPKQLSGYEKERGYYEDFSDFDLYPPDPLLIQPIFEVFQKLISRKRNVIIITARGNAIPVSDFLTNHGIVEIPIHAVGGSDPTLKSNIVQEMLENEKPRSVILFEDSKKNIAAISSMMKNFSNIPLKIVEVPHLEWLNAERVEGWNEKNSKTMGA